MATHLLLIIVSNVPHNWHDIVAVFSGFLFIGATCMCVDCVCLVYAAVNDVVQHMTAHITPCEVRTCDCGGRIDCVRETLLKTDSSTLDTMPNPPTTPVVEYLRV